MENKTEHHYATVPSFFTCSSACFISKSQEHKKHPDRRSRRAELEKSSEKSYKDEQGEIAESNGRQVAVLGSWTGTTVGFPGCSSPHTLPKKVLLMQKPLLKLIQVIAQVVQFDLTGFWLAASATVMLVFLDV